MFDSILHLFFGFTFIFIAGQWSAKRDLTEWKFDKWVKLQYPLLVAMGSFAYFNLSLSIEFGIIKVMELFLLLPKDFINTLINEKREDAQIIGLILLTFAIPPTYMLSKKTFNLSYDGYKEYLQKKESSEKESSKD